MKKILVLGCGLKRYPHAIHLDINPGVNPDIVHDLTKFPWPFEDDRFKTIIAAHILEHIWTQGDVEGFFRLWREIFRICENRATVICETPYAMHPVAYADIGHRSFWIPATYNYICKKAYEDGRKKQNAMSQYNIDFDFQAESIKLLKFKGRENEEAAILEVILKVIK